jgi:hypothetical protein
MHAASDSHMCDCAVHVGTGSRSPLGSGEHSHALLGRSRSPGRGGPLAASWASGVGRNGPPRYLQLVERASSPLTMPADGSLPPGEHMTAAKQALYQVPTACVFPAHAMLVH